MANVGTDWDTPSRFGGAGSLARRVLRRLLRPALMRQAEIDRQLSLELDAQREALAVVAARLQRIAAVDLGTLSQRVDLVERRAELAPVEALVLAAPLPPDGERSTVVAHDWGPQEQRRVLCSAGTGRFSELLAVSASTLEAYARRHRWDLVISREESAEGRPAPWGKIPLARALLREYDVMAWVDADAIVVDLRWNLADELEPGKDLYLVEHSGGTPVSITPNTGVFMLRASEWTDRVLDEIWARTDLVEHRWWENAALLQLLGYRTDPLPVRRVTDSPWLERVKFLDLAWNSMPPYCRSPRPRINHYGSATLARRRAWMLDDLRAVWATGGLVPDAVLDVERPADLPVLLNRLGLVGTAVEVGVRDGGHAAWLLHRWGGGLLISVDPWRDAERNADTETIDQDVLYLQTLRRLAPFGERSAVWRATSAEAALSFDDATLDLVSLGVGPDAVAVAEELVRWLPKLRPGGVIAGNDLAGGAVERHFATLGLSVRPIERDCGESSWWVLTPSR